MNSTVSAPALDSISPWLAIWFQPRRAMRYVLDRLEDRELYTLGIAMLAGIGQGLSSVSQNAEVLAPLGLQIVDILLIGVIAGPVLNIINVYLVGLLYWYVGMMVGGEGTYGEVRAAIAWASLPQILTLLVWVPVMLIFGSGIFTGQYTGADTMSTAALAMVACLGLVVIGMSIWSFILLLKCLGEAHRFSAWRAWGVTILSSIAIAVILIPVVCILVFVFGAALSGG